MKVLIAFAVFVLSGIYINAQSDAKVIAEIAASSERTIKNAPFSAEAVSESVQVLADGNRIVHRSTTKMYRNSEGRFRRESGGGTGGVLGSFYTFGRGVTILDPVEGQRFMLDDTGKIARVMSIGGGRLFTIARGLGSAESALGPDQKTKLEREAAAVKTLSPEDRAKTEAVITKIQVAGEISGRAPMAVSRGLGNSVYSTSVVSGEGGFSYVTGQSEKYETRTEELGSRDIEGVMAEGTRRVTTIPAGAIGNERPIEISYERWYSKELELVVYSKQSDPRFGEQTYKLTNIVRSEPDPSLFTVPPGYKVMMEPATVYRLAPPKPRSVASPRAVVAPMPAKAPSTRPPQPQF